MHVGLGSGWYIDFEFESSVCRLLFSGLIVWCYAGSTTGCVAGLFCHWIAFFRVPLVEQACGVF
jgi:hypothetical protein